MNVLKKIAGIAAVAALSLGLTAPSISLASQQGRNTMVGGLVGAGVGAAATHGSVGGTLVGAGAGALIGNSLSHHRHHRHYDHGRYDHRRYDDRRYDNRGH